MVLKIRAWFLEIFLTVNFLWTKYSLTTRKKLMERETWYKGEKGKDETDKEKAASQEEPVQEQKRSQKRKRSQENRENDEPETKKKTPVNPVKAAMFVASTPGSELAQHLRENEYQLERMTGSRLKIVEKSGNKLKT